MSASQRQIAYMRLLEYLTCSEYFTIESQKPVQHRIRALKKLAQDRGVPEHKYVASPVKSYFDPSIMHADARNAMQRKADAAI